MQTHVVNVCVRFLQGGGANTFNKQWLKSCYVSWFGRACVLYLDLSGHVSWFGRALGWSCFVIG
jgi:hypothetical protein